MNHHEWESLGEDSTLSSIRIGGRELKVGDSVRLFPGDGGDILDMALAGQIAVIESIEQDYEEKVHLAVVLENDPGKDLGFLKQPGHRFFFGIDEVEPYDSPRE
jgi:hypothetical protein